MGKGDRKSLSATIVQPPAIFAATLGPAGSVLKGAPLTQAQAGHCRRAGTDVVFAVQTRVSTVEPPI
jgi:hypothetical protein